MKAAVIVFPGTNCDSETLEALKWSGFQAEYVWHDWTSLEGFNLVVLPGGFSYGDYLRPGAIARFSPVMKAVENYVAEKRGMVLGICNGFQILLEDGLLPGAMMRNACGHFICRSVALRVENTPLFAQIKKRLILYIAHSDGRYIADRETVTRLERGNRILMRYEENPNGAMEDIAAIANEDFSVIGMMPHPERSVLSYHHNLDGLEVFQAMRRWLNASRT